MSNASPPQLPPLPPAAPDSASSASDWFNLSAIAKSEQLEAEDDAPETARDSQSNLVFDPNPFVGDYQIVDQLDAGSVTRDYRARKNGRDGLVVLRVIRFGPAVNSEELARLRQIVEKAAALRHPDIVQIYDVGTRPGMIYFAQETLAGGTLAARTARQPQSPDRAADLVETIARAVHAAHEAGIVHGGLKPGNILLDGVGRPRVADFGLSRQFGSPSESPFCYLAPEQLDGGAASVAPAADLFALGEILYELLTGRPPFLGPTRAQTVEYVRSHEPTSPRLLIPDLPRDLEAICLTCLRKSPDQRYPSAKLLADDLGRFRRGEPIQARSQGWTAKVIGRLRRRQ